MMSASSQQSFLGSSGRVVAALLVLLAAGCKSGSSWNAKPSWWSLGGDDPAKLASAPPAAGDVAKPSATAKPYPTTSTPEGYVLENAQRGGASPAVAATTAPASPPTAPAAVTYGSKPTEPTGLASAPPAAAATSAQPSGPSSISPQVGLYGAPPAAPPAADQPLPTAAAAFATTPPTDPAMASAPPSAPIDSRFGTAGARVADARGSDAWAQPPAAAPAAPESRYAASGGSRFTSAAPASEPPATSFQLQPPTAEPAPAAMPMPAAGQLPAAAPASGSLPAAAPAVPTRRPDPGYRPGGTSSYRHSRTILAGSDETTPTGVTPVSYETPASP